MRALILLATLLAVRAGAADTLAERVAAAPDAVVRMSFPARDGICAQSNQSWTRRGDQDWEWVCDGGPVRVQVEKGAAGIAGLDTYLGGRWRPRDGVTDLGDVDPAAARDFLLDLAERASAGVAADAVMPAAIADAPDPWQRLLALSRDGSRPYDVRRQAIFWLGRSAAREATAGLAAIAQDDPETEVQKAAVFALSQGRDAARVDALVKVARGHRNPKVVESALFWLAQSQDPRALDLFEDILRK
jgi:HEAT repeat protein